MEFVTDVEKKYTDGKKSLASSERIDFWGKSR